MRLLDFGIAPYLKSQAIYHAVADMMTAESPDTLILITPDRPYFCVGFHQDARQELDLDYCRAHNLPVLRRHVGGGATFLDSHQPFYQLVVHHRRAPAVVDALYKFALTAPVETLRALGLPAELRGANEIVVNGKRIAGIGAGRIGEASVVVGNFLCAFDYEMMARAWRVPNENYRRLAREGMERWITTLRAELQTPPTVPELDALLVEKYQRTLDRSIVRGALTADEERCVEKYERTLGADEWLFEIDVPPRSRLKIADGVWMYHESCFLLVGGADGALEVTLRAKERAIDALAIEAKGGFGGMIWRIVAQMLTGAPLTRDELNARLARMYRSGLLPAELNLEPLVNLLVRLGKT